MKESTPRHIKIKILKLSDREKNLNSSKKKGRREKIHYMQRKIREAGYFCQKTTRGGRQCRNVLKQLKEKTVNLEFFFTQQNYYSRNQQNKDLFKHRKAEIINHHQTSTKRNFKGFSRRRITPDRILDLHKGTKNTRNGKYVGKYI